MNMKRMLFKFILLDYIILLIFGISRAGAQDNPELQPVVVQTNRLIETLETLGSPILASDKAKIEKAYSLNDEEGTIRSIQTVIDSYALFNVEINPESRVKVK